MRPSMTYFDDWTLVRLYKLFLTERKLAKICANGVTIKSSTWLLARSLAMFADVVAVSAASFILNEWEKRVGSWCWDMHESLIKPLARYARISRHGFGRHLKIGVRSIQKWFAPLRHVLENESGGWRGALKRWARALSIFNVEAAIKNFSSVSIKVSFKWWR